MAWMDDRGACGRRVVVAVVMGLATWGAAPSAQAGIPECGGIHVEADAACSLEIDIGCDVDCDLDAAITACANELSISCQGDCDLSADVTCTDDCGSMCEERCLVGDLKCQDNCRPECIVACPDQCSDAD
ncbi:MAG: hypothetical protein JNK45_15875, partial [Myxococcales bacterium]|nr:hypothetical protein [Myxococcales bacterium]